MAEIWALVTSKLTGPLALAGCAVLAVMLAVKWGEVASLRGRIEDPKTRYITQIAEARAGGAVCRAELAAQNAAIDAQAAAKMAKMAEAAKAIDEGLKRLSGLTDKASVILKAPVSADLCASADQFLIAGAKP